MDIRTLEKNQKLIAASRPFQEPMLSQLRQYYRIGLTWSSNALEGNTLTESETKCSFLRMVSQWVESRSAILMKRWAMRRRMISCLPFSAAAW